MTLPRTLSDLRSLRAARWTRESRPGQYDHSGPAAQRFDQDAAIEQHGMIDTGLAWEAAHSGWKDRAIARSAKWADMLARAGRDYDVLVVAYVSRFCRNVRIGTAMREQLHLAGATIYFCDERILLSDEADWKRWIDLQVEAEHYTRNLQRTMQRTYATRWRAYGDPGGMTPLGFRRSGGTPSVLQVDPVTIGQVINLFQRFALGTVSTEQLAQESGLHVERIKPILRNRIYNGYVQRYGEWREAEWRDDPPVSDALWHRVEAVRESRTRGGGPRRSDRVDLLGGLLRCVCGARVWSDGYSGTGKHRKRHRAPCPAWGSAERLHSDTWEVPISAQVSQLDLSPATMARLADALASPPPMPDDVGRKRIERERRELADGYARGGVPGSDFLAADAVLTARLEALRAAPATSQGITSAEALDYLRSFSATWADADAREQADLIHATYERIEVAGPRIVSVTPTPDAARHGIALALPEQVNIRSLSQVAMVGGEGLEPQLTTVHIPIIGRAQWLRAAGA